MNTELNTRLEYENAMVGIIRNLETARTILEIWFGVTDCIEDTIKRTKNFDECQLEQLEWIERLIIQGQEDLDNARDEFKAALSSAAIAITTFKELKGEPND